MARTSQGLHQVPHLTYVDLKLNGNKDVVPMDKLIALPWATDVVDSKGDDGACSVHGDSRSRKYVDWELCQRSQFTWTALIAQSTKRGQFRQALDIYEEMRDSGVKPNSYTFVAALKACSSLRNLEIVKRIHSHVVDGSLQSDVYTGTMLTDVYVKCGSLGDARYVFENLSYRTVISWNVMIMGYAQMGQGDVALHLFTRMQQEGIVPNDRTFVSALKACSSLTASQGESTASSMNRKCLEQVRSIHSRVEGSSFEFDVFVGTMLVDAYAKCGSLVDARHVFEKMPHRDVISWNAMILGYAHMEQGEKALELYAQMQQDIVAPDDRTFIAALKACSCLAAKVDGRGESGKDVHKRCLGQVRAIHLELSRRGFESRAIVGNMLVDVYVKCGSLVNARSVFETIRRRDVVSWNVMILGYAQMEEGEEALQLYARMQQEGVPQDDRTFVGALRACSSLAAQNHDKTPVRDWCLHHVRNIHSDVVKYGCELDVFVATMLVDVYAKCGSLTEARRVFEKMPYHDVVAWTAMIFGYVQMEDGEMALQMFHRMKHTGVTPNKRTFIGAVMACGIVARLDEGKEIHRHILQLGIEATDSFVACSLIDMYCKCGSMEDARQMFDSLPKRDMATWNALIAGYARRGDSQVVFDLFERMIRGGMQPEAITFLNVLIVCSHVGLVDEGHKYFEAMSTDFGITPALEHYSCMVDLLGRAGHLTKAMAMVNTMPFRPDSTIWKSLMSACRMWNDVELGRQAFERAVRLDSKDVAVYDIMINICTSARLWEDAQVIQEMRVKTGAWKQQGQSCYSDISGNVHAFVVGDHGPRTC